MLTLLPPLALGARRIIRLPSRLPGINRLGFQPSLVVSEHFQFPANPRLLVVVQVDTWVAVYSARQSEQFVRVFQITDHRAAVAEEILDVG